MSASLRIVRNQSWKTHSEDGDAADKGGVLGRGQGLISRGNEAFGGAAAALLAVDSLGRHCEFAEELVRIGGDEAQSVMGRVASMRTSPRASKIRKSPAIGRIQLLGHMIGRLVDRR